MLIKVLFLLQAELADIIGGYKKLSGNDLIKDAEAKFSENMKKLILPKLKKGNKNSIAVFVHFFFVLFIVCPVSMHLVHAGLGVRIKVVFLSI